MKMYGSTHTHLEDAKDAVTDMHVAITSFIGAGAKKVAATSHGTFTQYEMSLTVLNEAKAFASEVLEILGDAEYPQADENEVSSAIISESVSIFGHPEEEKVKSNPSLYKSIAERINDFNIVPGVEAYFTDKKKHLILIAKNNEGYAELSKVLTGTAEYIAEREENEYADGTDEDLDAYDDDDDTRNKKSKEKPPILTLDILKKYVTPGNLICTTACINGVFGSEKLDAIRLQQDIEKIQKKLPIPLDKAKEYKTLLDEYDAKKREKKETGFTKAKDTLVNREKKKIANGSDPNNLDGDIALESVGMTIDEWEAKKTKVEGINNTIERKYEYLVTDTEDPEKKQIPYAKVVQRELDRVNEETGEKCLTILNKILKKEQLLEKIKPEYEEGFEESASLYEEFVDIFGENGVFFEIQNHGIPEEEEIYNGVVSLAYRLTDNPQFIAANDIHVCVTSDSPHLEREMLRRKIAQTSRFGKYSPISEPDKQLIIKSDEELKASLSQIIRNAVKRDGTVVPASQIIDSAIGNIEGLLSECNIEKGEKLDYYPKFCDNDDEVLEKIAWAGLEERFGNVENKQVYVDRLERELGIIKSMGYSSYHLIVQDYIEYGKLLGYLNPEDVENAPLHIEDVVLSDGTKEDGLKTYVQKKVDAGEIKKIGLGVGPGRGSAAGSLVCTCLGITDVDPIENDLLFERFLNPERVSMPDIDTDFAPHLRSKVYDYCCARYGKENVGRIITKSYFQGKGAIKEAGRFLANKKISESGYATESKEAKDLKSAYFGKANYISKEFSRLEKTTQPEEIVDELLKMFGEDSIEAEMLRTSKVVDGIMSGYGQHAGGTVISKSPIKDVVPLMWNSGQGAFAISCDMGVAEEKGLLKMDTLGLKNLNIITECCKHPFHAEPISLFQTQEGMKKAFSDRAVYKDIFATGDTCKVFQFESPGMRSMLRDFKPESFDDIVLLIALYRPGPMSFIGEITQTKWKDAGPEAYAKYCEAHKINPNAPIKKTISVKNEALDKILKPTYGCPVYQEQIMKIFQDMAGYSLGGADIVRRYMSKKKEDKLLAEKKAFVYGDEKRGIPGCMKLQGLTEQEASDLFEQMKPFAKYGFNKSHAAAYAQVAVETAWLKKYYPVDFYKAVLNNEKELDTRNEIIGEIHTRRVTTVLPPDIKHSENGFSIVETDKGKEIVAGFSAIKGVGSVNLQSRVENAQEFIEQNPGIPKKQIINMAMLGMIKGTWSELGYNGNVDTIDNTVEFVENFFSILRNPPENFNEIKEEDIRIQLERKPLTTNGLMRNARKLDQNIEELLGSNYLTKSPMLEALKIATEGIKTETKSSPFYATTFAETKGYVQTGNKKCQDYLIPVIITAVDNNGGAGYEPNVKPGATYRPPNFQYVTLQDQSGAKFKFRYSAATETPAIGEMILANVKDFDHRNWTTTTLVAERIAENSKEEKTNLCNFKMANGECLFVEEGEIVNDRE